MSPPFKVDALPVAPLLTGFPSRWHAHLSSQRPSAGPCPVRGADGMKVNRAGGWSTLCGRGKWQALVSGHGSIAHYRIVLTWAGRRKHRALCDYACPFKYKVRMHYSGPYKCIPTGKLTLANTPFETLWKMAWVCSTSLRSFSLRTYDSGQWC